MTTTPKGEYERLEPARQPFDRRAELASALTIPSLFTSEGKDSSSDTNTPFQSIGAEGVSNLSSLLILGLLPPSIPFFRLQMDEGLRAELRGLQENEEFDGNPLSETQESLALWERTIMRSIERSNYRTPGDQMARLLVTTGNTMVELLPKGGQRTMSLKSYVCERTPGGDPALAVIKESIRKDRLPEEVVAQITDHAFLRAEGKDVFALYTQITWGKARYEITVSVEEWSVTPEGDAAGGKVENCPFLPLRFRANDGEHYGRGLVDEYFGALKTTETLSQAMVEAAAAAAKIIFLVQPGSVTNPAVLARAANLSFKAGRLSDIEVLQVSKFADFRVARETLNDTQAQLERIFLVGSVRDSERTTAAEISFMKDNLERRHPGLFGRLSTDWQTPVVRHEMRMLERKKALPKLDDRIAEPVIVTGAAALGRSTEAAKIMDIISGVAAALGPQAVETYFVGSELIRRLTSAEGVDPSGLVRTDAEITKRAQEAQQAQLQAQAGTAAVDVGKEAVGSLLSTPSPDTAEAAA